MVVHTICSIKLRIKDEVDSVGRILGTELTDKLRRISLVSSDAHQQLAPL